MCQPCLTFIVWVGIKLRFSCFLGTNWVISEAWFHLFIKWLNHSYRQAMGFWADFSFLLFFSRILSLGVIASSPLCLTEQGNACVAITFYRQICLVSSMLLRFPSLWQSTWDKPFIRKRLTHGFRDCSCCSVGSLFWSLSEHHGWYRITEELFTSWQTESKENEKRRNWHPNTLSDLIASN